MKINVYALKSILKNYIYVGMTNDLERRLLEHNKKQKETQNLYLFLFKTRSTNLKSLIALFNLLDAPLVFHN